MMLEKLDSLTSDRTSSKLTIKKEDLDMGRVVTIDGPAASGKTSVSRELARRLGWSWVSTGAFYRGLAYCAHELKLDLNSESVLSQFSLSSRWKVEMDDAFTRVFLDQKDVTDKINLEVVGSIASKISHFPLVRESLLTPQRDCAIRTEGLVAEGRDCGTVVFPTAEVKIYLTAKQEHRAERRAKELGLSTAETVQAQAQRDKQDSTRKAAPLSVPKNALVVDTTDLNFEQVVDLIEKFVRKHI
jgi:CMP/dCMP kinase